MRQPAEPRLRRFTRAEKWVHRTTAALVGVCVATALVLYQGPFGAVVGHRRTVELLHVYAGFALPVPLLLGFGSAAYRADLRRLNRFVLTDGRWLRSRSRRDGTIRVGKFNAGQKLNASLTAGAIVVLLGTGTLMFFPDLVRLTWRTGATFVHDWFALGLGLLVAGHVAYAVRDPEARAGLRRGTVSLPWARRHHAEWASEEAHAAEWAAEEDRSAD